MAVDQKWIEQFGEVDTSTPLTRTISDTWQALKDRGHNIATAWETPSISAGEAVAHTGAQAVGGLIDVASAPVGFVADAVVPGRVGEEAIQATMQKLGETEAGQFVMQQWEELPEETKLRISSGGVAVEALAAGLGFKPAMQAVARNADAQVPDFYSGNPFAKTLGMIHSFGKKGASAALTQAVNPASRALLRQGVPQGLVNEVGELANTLRMYDTVMAKRGDVGNMSLDERRVYDHIMRAGRVPKMDDKSLSAMARASHHREPASPATLRSFIEGALMTRVNLLKQQGMDTGILEALTLNPLASNVSRIGDSDFLGALGDVPESFKQRLTNHAIAVHGVNPDKAIGLNRTAMSDVKLQGEATGQMGTAQGRLFKAFDQETKPLTRAQRDKKMGGADVQGPVQPKLKAGQLHKLGVESFKTPTELAWFVESSNLPSTEQRRYLELNRKGSRRTAAETERLTELDNKIDSVGRIRMSGQPGKSWKDGPADDGYYYFQDTHHSVAKELGGVNTLVAVNPDTGDAISAITDGSDLLGYSGPGMDSLVTFVEPVKWNIYEPVKKGTTKRAGAPMKSTREEAIEATRKATGVEPSDVKIPGTSDLSSYSADVLEQFRPKPMLRDYVSASGNAAKLATTGGLMASHNYNREEQQ